MERKKNLNNNMENIVYDFETDMKKYMDSMQCENTLRESMSYSLLSGGKRIRPLLMFSSAKLCNIDYDKIMKMAMAMEMIHTYSLIHDDLPSMDNDDYRRGKLTNHKKYGEAIAILAGDALLNEAHTILIENYCYDENSRHASSYLSNQAGKSGMINGQIIDIENEHKKIDLIKLRDLHRCKTGAIIKASLVAPFLLNGENQEKINIISELGDELGILFQIQDDILDVTSDFKTLGKSIGKDEANEKSTYVTLLGMDESKRKLEETFLNIKKLIKELDAETSQLNDLIEKIYKRNK